jgi:precorrin-3B C17-methyltransferase
LSKIFVVGLGPGELSQITPKALEALRESDVIAGYDLYIELIKPLITDKEIISTGMKKEVERCRSAVETALTGKTVAVVSSGDAGIYGMAGLIHEIAAEYEQTTEIEVIGGITAASSAAAILGAPLTHDFAVISLSDLLTPWESIEKRLDFASLAGFVICLYNPSSKKRGDYLNKACEIVMKNLDKNTACGYVKNIGRDGEEYKVLTLKELSESNVDMFTTVIIGNKDTKVVRGKLVTPRGYRGV